MQPSQLLSVHQAAIRLGAAEDTVITWAQEGALPAQRVDDTYWFQPADIAAFAEAHPMGNPPGDGVVNDLVRPPDDRAAPR